MKAQDWSSGFGKAIGVFFNGETIPSPDARGQRVVDDSFLVLFNAHHEPLSFTTPAQQWGVAGCGCSTRRTPSTKARAWTPSRPPRWTREAWRCCAGRADVDLHVERRDGEDDPVLAVHGELDLDGAPSLRRA